MRLSSPSDDPASRYLLGLLAPAERERWEEGVLADRHAYEATLAAEDDLVDAYARGELGRRERAAFESQILPREGVAERVAFARALAAAAERAATEEGGGAGRDATRPRRLSPAVRWAAAAAVALVVAGGAWVGLRHAALGGRVAELEAALGDARAERQRLADDRERLAARLDEERAARQRERAETGSELAGERARSAQLTAELEGLRPPAPRATTVSYLLGVATRSEDPIPKLVLPAETGRVQLQLDTGGDEGFESYRARVLAPPSGRVAWSRTGLPPDDPSGRPAVELDLPAEIFVTGRYRVELEGQAPGAAEPELLAAFEFDVVRR